MLQMQLWNGIAALSDVTTRTPVLFPLHDIGFCSSITAGIMPIFLIVAFCESVQLFPSVTVTE